MLYLFSNKAALRKAMVGLSQQGNHPPSTCKTIETIANYLTNGGLSKVDAKIKAQEEIVASLERQSEILAEVIRAKEDRAEWLDGEITKGFDVLEILKADLDEKSVAHGVTVHQSFENQMNAREDFISTHESQ